ncbi:MAG: hypothetical protein WCQ89_07725 [Verrucomicrobiota bacterium]
MARKGWKDGQDADGCATTTDHPAASGIHPAAANDYAAAWIEGSAARAACTTAAASSLSEGVPRGKQKGEQYQSGLKSGQ